MLGHDQLQGSEVGQYGIVAVLGGREQRALSLVAWRHKDMQVPHLMDISSGHFFRQGLP